MENVSCTSGEPDEQQAPMSLHLYSSVITSDAGPRTRSPQTRSERPLGHLEGSPGPSQASLLQVAPPEPEGTARGTDGPMGGKSPGLRASWLQSGAGPGDPVLHIWGPRLRRCTQIEQTIRPRFTFTRATRPPALGQLTADSGVTPPGRDAVIFSIAAAQGEAGNSCSAQ